MKGNELKPHIGIFGRRNYGKSSLVNYLTGQPIAIVSDQAGTTTDPVKKSMEIGGVGPVVWIDTAGIDDEGKVGQLRVQKSMDVLNQVDLALILFSNNKFEKVECLIVDHCRDNNIPFILIYSRADEVSPDPDLLKRLEREYMTDIVVISLLDPSRRGSLLDRIRDSLPESIYVHKSLLGDVIAPGSTVVLVTPIDSSAPEGRMILPQVQVLRDILDNHAKAAVCRETELESMLKQISSISLVVTDSQVYDQVSRIVPDDIPLTSFSVVLARAKGLFEQYLQGTPTIAKLQEGDRVLLLESCTHNVTCEDIGRVKIPRLLAKFTGKQLQYEILGGQSQPAYPWSSYALVIQCGGCVVTQKQLFARLNPAIEAGVPVSNYGLAIAYMTGIFQRSVRIFQKNNH